MRSDRAALDEAVQAAIASAGEGPC
jgi:hypothetical protein